MARYDYRCPNCGRRFEVEHPMGERPAVHCASCGGKAQRVFSASGIHFEGHGFYNTDQRASTETTT
ncbi:MAG: zinc ribbon domain-containing protein [Acidobacteriota bacterium]|nr:zinc ribbon domain-containing protein [Acidobacteriota bacterium]